MSDEILIRLPRDGVAGFDPSAEQVGLAHASREIILLRRLQGAIPQDYLRLFGSTRVLWAGDLLHGLNLNHATGRLVFYDESVRKEIHLKNGEIIFAQSNLAHDRLGESLIRAGKITQQQLDDAATEINQTRKLGQILVESGLISPKELFVGVRRQVEEIAWSILDLEGRYVFYQGFADPDSILALNLETHTVLVDGIRRTAPWAHIPVDVPEREISLALQSAGNRLNLNQDEKKLAGIIVNGLNLRELIEQSGLGKLETYKIVHHLVRREIVRVGRVDDQPRVAVAADSQLAQTVDNFGEIFSEVIMLLRASAPDIDVVGRLNSFFDSLPDELAAVFGTVRFDESGRLDTAAIAGNATQLEKASRSTVLRAFNELLYFTLFEMKNFLSDDDASRIMEVIESIELF